MTYKLQDLIDLDLFQNLQDRLNQIYSFPSAIIDNDGNILTAVGWQDICTQFHRKNKDCERECRQSDQYILSHLHEANPAVSYRCPRGLVDNAAPIIIDGIHYGNFFTGQFFLEKPDPEFYRAQAKKYGFEEEAYLKAVQKVPIWTQDQLNNYLFFIKGLIAVISESGLKRLKEIETRKQIAESDESFGAILTQMHDGFWVTNAQDGRIIDANEAMCRMLGYARDELLKMSVADVEAIDSPAVIAQRIQHIVQSGSDRFESRFRRKDGTILEVEVSVTYLPKRKVFFGFHRDIMERKRAEEKMLYFQKAVDGAQDAIGMSTPDGRHFYQNEAFSKLFGLSVADVDGASGPPETVYADKNLGREVFDTLKKGDQWIGELEMFDKDKNERNIFLRAYSIKDEAGKVSGLVGIHTDITERKRAEKKLITIMKAVESTSDAVGMSDAQGRHFYQNSALSNLFGYATAEELQAAGGGAAVVKDPEVAREMFERIMSGKSWAGELEMVTKSGRVFPAYERADAIMNDDGQIIGLIGIVTDITERKRMEAEQAKLEAQNRQLQKSESLGRMAGAIAHHFNNQLQATMMSLELAKNCPPRNEGFTQILTEALQSTRQAAEVSRLMLTYLGQTQGRQEPLDLSAACHRSLALLRTALPPSVLLETDLPCPGPAIHSDANQIQQVLTNLVTNACEAIGEGRGTLRLTVKTLALADVPATCCFPIDWRPRDPAYACLEVADTGCGIADLDIEQIFDPFFTTKFTGRGLGLSVVLGIVRAHGGAITVESKPGRGSVFRIFFPVSAEAAPQPPKPVAPVPKLKDGGTVLLVEDQSSLRKPLAKVLTSLGFMVLEAEDGVQAVEIFRRHQDEIRFVLCDLTMPRMNGWETLAAVRQLAPGIPFILSSGYNEAYALEGDHPELPQAFLSKPYEFQRLREVISRVLTGQKR